LFKNNIILKLTSAIARTAFGVTASVDLSILKTAITLKAWKTKEITVKKNENIVTQKGRPVYFISLIFTK